MERILQHPHRRLFLAGLVAYLLAALCGAGFTHPDEHFQILEFASARLGLSPLTDLPWEYHERIRPTLQPVVAMGVIWFLRHCGILSPFVIAAVLRVGIALLGFFVTCRAVLALEPRLRREDSRKFLVSGAMLLWFMPLLSSRFSSENLAAILILAAVSLLSAQLGEDRADDPPLRLFLAAGALLGLAFFARFQIAFAILGIGLWLLWVARVGEKRLLALGLGFAAVCAACVAIDGWFYGEPVLSPLRYFYANLVQNRAAEWGVAPWWWYIPQLLLWSFPLIGIPLLGLAIWGAVSRRKDLVVFWAVPFAAAHLFIAHKELRFLFPLAFPLVYLAACGWDALALSGVFAALGRRAGVWALALGAMVLGGRLAFPTPYELGLARAVWTEASAGARTVTVFSIGTPLYEWFVLPVHFYRHPNVRTEVVAEVSLLQQKIAEQTDQTVYVVRSDWAAPKSFPGRSVETLFSFPPASIEPHMPPWARAVLPLHQLLKLKKK